jgi:hypothetical protein
MRNAVPEHQRTSHTAHLFGQAFPLLLEPTVYGWASRLSPDYSGGYWQFFHVSNGGFCMAPEADHAFRVIADNCYEGRLSADAFGIVTCVYSYSHLSFIDNHSMAQVFAQHFHWLRDYLLDQPEAEDILRAID